MGMRKDYFDTKSNNLSLSEMAAPMLREVGATTSAGKTGCSLIRGAARPPAYESSPPCQVSHLQQGATLVPRSTTLTSTSPAAMSVLRGLVLP